LWHHSRGTGSSKVSPPAEAKSISRSTTFEKDSRHRPFLEATLQYLSERVGAGLRKMGRQARCVVLKVRYADFTTITRRSTLRTPSDADQVIFDCGLKLLEKELAREKQPVRLIGIGVANFSEMGQQLDMLDASGVRRLQLNEAVDEIRKKYGFPAIQKGRTLLLRDLFSGDDGGYRLHTPSLSR
jgi:DNA polymerase-4